MQSIFIVSPAGEITSKTQREVWIRVMAEMVAAMDTTVGDDAARLLQFNRAVHFAAITFCAEAGRAAAKAFVRKLLLKRYEFLIAHEQAQMENLPAEMVDELNAIIAHENAVEQHALRSEWQQVEQAAHDIAVTEHTIHVDGKGTYLLVMPDELEGLLQSGVIIPEPAPAELLSQDATETGGNLRLAG